MFAAAPGLQVTYALCPGPDWYGYNEAVNAFEKTKTEYTTAWAEYTQQHALARTKEPEYAFAFDRHPDEISSYFVVNTNDPLKSLAELEEVKNRLLRVAALHAKRAELRSKPHPEHEKLDALVKKLDEIKKRMDQATKAVEERRRF